MRGQNTNRTSNENENEDGGASARRHSLQIGGKEASPREYARVMNAQPPQYSEDEIQAALEENASRPFSILRRR